MTDSIWETIAEIPWWMYALGIYGCVLIASAKKPRTIAIQHLMILPGTFVALSFVLLYYSSLFSLFNWGVYLGGLLSGIFLGWLQFKLLRVKAIKASNKLYFKGSWSLSIIILIILTAKLFFNAKNMIDPQTVMQHLFLFAFLYGLIPGLLFGRLIYSVRCLKHGPFVSV